MKPFDKYEAFDQFIKLYQAPASPPSEAIKAQVRLLDFFQKIHDQAFEAGFKECLNKNFNDHDTSK
jgi:hypothetical protein